MYNLLEGKAKEEFDKWMTESIDHEYVYYDELQVLDVWKNLTPSMQQGVLVDFFDSEGVIIEISSFPIENTMYRFQWDSSIIFGSNEVFIDHLETRHEARESGIKEAVKLFNQEHDKKVEN